MEGAPLGANQIDLFMHFLSASRDGLVTRRVDLDTISSSVIALHNSKQYHTLKTSIVSSFVMSLPLTYLETMGNGCAQFKYPFMLSCFPPRFHDFDIKNNL
jgi:hypothetical protein